MRFQFALQSGQIGVLIFALAGIEDFPIVSAAYGGSPNLKELDDRPYRLCLCSPLRCLRGRCEQAYHLSWRDGLTRTPVRQSTDTYTQMAGHCPIGWGRCLGFPDRSSDLVN